MSCESERHIRAGTNVSDCKAKVILNEYIPLRWRDERSRGIYRWCGEGWYRGRCRGYVQKEISYAHLSIGGGISLWHKLDQGIRLLTPTWQVLMGTNLMEVQGQIYVSVKQKSN